MKYIIFYILVVFLLTSCSSTEPPPLDAFTISIPLKDTVVAEVIKEKVEVLDHDSTQWTELKRAIPNIVIDLKYATTDNFVGLQMYECPRAFLRPEATVALALVQAELEKDSLGLKILDAYRPRPVQQKLWDKVPDRRYVTPPAKGSMHNRGAAVDLTLIDKNGKELDMGTQYDFFGKEAWPEYKNLSEDILNNRATLQQTMAKYGFKPIRTEWWHFSFKGKMYPLSDWEWECQEE